MYRVGKREKNKRRRKIIWSVIAVLFIILVIVLIIVLKHMLKPDTVIKQSKAVVTQANFNTQTKTYEEPDFSVALPSTWTPLPRPAGPYQSYTWQSPDQGTDGQVIEIYENVIPPNFDVNRVQDVIGEVDHLTLNGTVSDNCSNFTKGVTPVYGQSGVPAKWQGIDFICDQGNTTRDVIGTSSPDGINMVILQTSHGVPHKFLFTYTDYNLNPDYSVFENMLQSVAMK